MIKRSPAIANPNSSKAAWFPRNMPNVQFTLMKLAGFESPDRFPEMESYNINLRFFLDAGQTRTESIASKDGTWILLERMATIKVDNELGLLLNDSVMVTSSITSDKGKNITLIEEQPISNIFGDGEWQTDIFPDTWNSVNNRIFSVKNLTQYQVVVDLGFKLARVSQKT